MVKTLGQMVQKYRSEMKRSEQRGVQRGAHVFARFYRSKREQGAQFGSYVIAAVIFTFPYNYWSWPFYVHVLVIVGIGLAFYGGWVAWVVWGREAFPLRSDLPVDGGKEFAIGLFLTLPIAVGLFLILLPLTLE